MHQRVCNPHEQAQSDTDLLCSLMPWPDLLDDLMRPLIGLLRVSVMLRMQSASRSFSVIAIYTGQQPQALFMALLPATVTLQNGACWAITGQLPHVCLCVFQMRSFSHISCTPTTAAHTILSLLHSTCTAKSCKSCMADT